MLPVKTNVLIGTEPITITISLSNPLPGISTVNQSINQTDTNSNFQIHDFFFSLPVIAWNRVN